MNEQAQGGGTPVTMEQVQKMLADSAAATTKLLTDGFGKLQSGMNAQAKAADAVGVRRKFIETNMKGLPDIYTEKMPETSDPAELARAEQAIRSMLQNDAKTMGYKIPNIGGDNHGGISPGGLSPAGVNGVQRPGIGGGGSPSELVMEGLRRVGNQSNQPAPQARE